MAITMARSVFSPGYDHFRRLLRDARTRAKLTQVQLAARLRRPQSFVAKYEQGERRIDVIEFLQIADALRFRPEAFIARLKTVAKGPRRRDGRRTPR